jgi:hypothetical protein
LIASTFNTQYPASHLGGQISVPGQAMWDVVDKMTLGQVLLKHFGFPCQFSIHQLSVLINHPIIGVT